MHKKCALAISLSCLFSINEGTCGRIVQYANLGVEDTIEGSSSTSKKNGTTITIKDIIQEDLLLDTEDKPEGINLAANVLTTKGIKELVNTITDRKNSKKFSQLKYVKLLSNPVDLDVLAVCRPLLERPNFEYLDLCETRAVSNPMFTSLLEDGFKDVANKLIFVPKRFLTHFKDRPQVFIPHQKYFDLNVWDKK